MTAPFLIPCLVTLRAEFNSIAPGRDKDSDGWIGDAAHQAGTSDHNPDSAGRVLAIDIDSTGPWPAPFADLVEHCRGDSRLEYVIYNRRIASRDQGWAWRTYTGTSDPHILHAHLSARHDHTGQNSTAPWGLEDIAMEASDVWAVKVPLQSPTETAAGALWEIHQRVPGDLGAVRGDIAALTAKVDQLAAAVAALTPPPTGR